MATKKKATAKRKVTKKAKKTPKKTVEVKQRESRKASEDRLLAPLEEIESLLGRLRRLQLPDWDWPSRLELPTSFKTRVPSIDIINRNKEIVVKAEVPGIDKDDIDISISGRTLTIKGESRHEEEKEEGDTHRREIRTGSFARILTLPEEVAGGKAKSSYKDGVVTLRLPKLHTAKKHRINID